MQPALAVDLTSLYLVSMGDMGDPPKSKLDAHLLELNYFHFSQLVATRNCSFILILFSIKLVQYFFSSLTTVLILLAIQIYIHTDQSTHNGLLEKRLVSLCVGCGNQIHDQYILRVSPDLEWHAACLKCAECSQYLDESCTCFVRDGKTYCKRDYIR